MCVKPANGRKQFGAAGAGIGRSKRRGIRWFMPNRRQSLARRRVLVYGIHDAAARIRSANGFRRLSRPRRDGNIYARGATDDKGQMLD